MRVAIYVHVPQEDGIEIAGDRLERLKQMAARDGWGVSSVYCDRVSLGDEERPEYQRMIADATQHRFDVLLFWALENLSPLNTSRSLALLHWLSARGIRFCAYKDQHLNTCHFLRDQVVSLIATFRKQDSVYISRRTMAGLKGKTGVGRPHKEFDTEKAKRLREQTPPATYDEIAAACKVSKTSVIRYFQKIGSKGLRGRKTKGPIDEKSRAGNRE